MGKKSVPPPAPPAPDAVAEVLAKLQEPPVLIALVVVAIGVLFMLLGGSKKSKGAKFLNKQRQSLVLGEQRL